MDKKSILFVDDEKSILKAIRRTFRGSPYNIFYANSAKEALELLNVNHVDIIISDYMMPDMDGYQLLKQIMNTSPNITRVILSGFTDEKVIFKSLFNGIVNTYISKPWNNLMLQEQIKKTIALKEDIESDMLKNFILTIGTLPTLPQIYDELLQAVDQEKDIKYIAEIIEKSPTISAKILHLVNSSFYGLPKTSIKNAVLFLGLTAIRDLIISLSVYNQKLFNNKELKILNILWEHSFLTNSYTHMIFNNLENRKIKPEFSSVSLLAHLGYVIFLLKSPEKFNLFFDALKKFDKENYEEIDEQIFGYTHSRAGSYLLNWWNIPHYTIESILYHHTPENITGGEENLKKYVLIADLLAWKKLGYLQNLEIDDKYIEIITNNNN